MNGIDEGYMALYISIVANKTIDDSFERLSGNFIRHQRVWTEKDFQYIEQMRSQGETWQNIADAIGCEMVTCRRAWERWRKRI